MFFEGANGTFRPVDDVTLLRIATEASNKWYISDGGVNFLPRYFTQQDVRDGLGRLLDKLGRFHWRQHYDEVDQWFHLSRFDSLKVGFSSGRGGWFVLGDGAYLAPLFSTEAEAKDSLRELVEQRGILVIE